MLRLLCCLLLLGLSFFHIRPLKRERGDLVMRIETRILDGKQILTIKKFAQRMRERLSIADWNFDTRRRIIEELAACRRETISLQAGLMVN